MPTVGKGAKDGFTVMVANAGDNTIMPFMLITKGATHQALKKFVKPLHLEFALASSGATWPTSKQPSVAHTMKDKTGSEFALYPPSSWTRGLVMWCVQGMARAG